MDHLGTSEDEGLVTIVMLRNHERPMYWQTMNIEAMKDIRADLDRAIEYWEAKNVQAKGH